MFVDRISVFPFFSTLYSDKHHSRRRDVFFRCSDCSRRRRVLHLRLSSSRKDGSDSVIHAFIPANRASHYRPSLKAGCIVRLERFEVTRVAHMYKVTEHQFLIRFLPSTHLGEVHTHAPVIKSERFMMRRYDQPRAPRYNTIRNIKSFTERIKGSGSQGPMNASLALSSPAVSFI